MCGDATAVTEQFAADYFEKLLNGIQYLRMGHHGSPTSSSAVFLGACSGIKTAVASTGGQKTKVHRLPKQRIIGLYPPKVEGGAPNHSIYAFERDDAIAKLYFTNLAKKIYATGSNDTYSLTIADA